MSCPLPHVLVMFNMSRRPALLLGAAPRHGAIRSPSACLLLVCLALSCSLARLASLLVSSLVGRDGLAMSVGCLRLWRGVRMSCGCRADVVRLRVPRFALLPVRLSPRSLDTDGGEGNGAIDVIVACFFRISPAMREFCGLRSLRLPGLLCHGILSMCRRGRMSTVAAHRNSLACFSIPISAPIFVSSPSSTPIAV